jgi:hypothetical protein
VEVDAEAGAGAVEGELAVRGNVVARSRGIVGGGLVAFGAEQAGGFGEVGAAHNEIDVEELAEGEAAVDMLGENGAFEGRGLDAALFECAQEAGQFQRQDRVAAGVADVKVLQGGENLFRDLSFYRCKIAMRERADGMGSDEIEESVPVKGGRDFGERGTWPHRPEEQVEFRICDGTKWRGHVFCIIPPGPGGKIVKKLKY